MLGDRVVVVPIVGTIILATALVACVESVPTPIPEEEESIVIRYEPEGICKRVGVDPAGLDHLGQVFEEMIEQGLHSGAQLAICRNGS